jgi:type I restriction enzyme, R subunit
VARELIDAGLIEAGWMIQRRDEMNLAAGRGVAVCEFKLAPGRGFADYLLFVDGKAVGVLEAKPAGHTLSGVEVQAEKYSRGLPAGLDPPVEPLPFLYLSTGAVTKFTNLLDPDPRSRRIFQVHQPGTLAEWLGAETLDSWVKSASHFATAANSTKPSSLRSRLRAMPPLEKAFLFPNQVQAVINLEHSLFQNRSRALVQMATGSGKTIMAVTAVYRLIKFGGARRVLFLVDRSNLSEQAEKEFQGYRTPDDNRKFTELYNVQRLTSNTIGASAKVVMCSPLRRGQTFPKTPPYGNVPCPNASNHPLLTPCPWPESPLVIGKVPMPGRRPTPTKGPWACPSQVGRSSDSAGKRGGFSVRLGPPLRTT